MRHKASSDSSAEIRHWRLHSALGLGLSLCVVGFVVELGRGMEGNIPAWAYVLEWPLFGVVGTIMWWRLLHDGGPRLREVLPHAPSVADPLDDPELTEWRAYVAQMQDDERDEKPSFPV